MTPAEIMDCIKLNGYTDAADDALVEAILMAGNWLGLGGSCLVRQKDAGSDAVDADAVDNFGHHQNQAVFH